MDRGRGSPGSRGRGNSGRGHSRGGRGRGRGRGGGGSPYIPKFPIGAAKIQEALDDPSADLGALVNSAGFKKLLSTDSFTGENKIYGQFKKTLALMQKLFRNLPRNGLSILCF